MKVVLALQWLASPFKDKYTVQNGIILLQVTKLVFQFHGHGADIHSSEALFMCPHISWMHTFLLWIVLCEAQHLVTEVKFWFSCAFPFFIIF